MASAPGTFDRSRNPAFANVAAYLLAGPLNWAVQFGLLYLLHTLACAEATAPVISPIFPVVATAIAIVSAGLSILAIIYASVLARTLKIDESSQATTYRQISSTLHALAIAGIAWSAIASHIVGRCVPVAS